MNRFFTFFPGSIHLFLICKMLLVDLNCRSVLSGLFWLLKTADTGGENLQEGAFHCSFGRLCTLSSDSLLISLRFMQSTVWIRWSVNSALYIYVRYNFPCIIDWMLPMVWMKKLLVLRSFRHFFHYTSCISFSPVQYLFESLQACTSFRKK